MRKLLFCLLIAAGFCSCSDDQGANGTLGNDSPETKAILRERPKYYSLEYKISSSALTPGPIATDGKVLAIANLDNYELALYGLENGSPQIRIRQWTYKDSTIRIQHVPTAVCVHDDRIYLGVADEGKVYVFNANSYKFITTIGNGNIQVDKASDDKFAVGAPCTIVGDGDKLLIRDRKRIRVYNIADITSDNYEAVPYYAASMEEHPIQPTTTLNQGYVGYNNYIYMTDADEKQVLIAKPLASIPAGDEVKMLEQIETFSTAPSGAAHSEDRSYLSFGTENVIKEYGYSGFGFKQNVVIKDNPLPEIKSIACSRVESQPVLLISTPTEVWMVWVTPFERMADEAE